MPEKTPLRILLFFLSFALVFAQDQPPPQPAPAPQTQPQTPAQTQQQPQTQTRAKRSNTTSKDRLFFTLPNFLTVENASKAPPLSAGQKFKVTARGSFDPVQFAWYGAQAGISQARDTDAPFGQGVEGYAKRFGERAADGIIENFFTRAIFPSVLHQDPRYYQLGKGGFWRRTYHAVSRVVITRSDAGATEFNFSEVLGSGSAAAVSVFSYHPSEDRTFHTVLNVWATQVGYDAVSFTLKEFWPDLRRKIHPSSSDNQTTQPNEPPKN